ncbi:hypothetical protein HRG_001605 [Hirsutella rhossiliensis]|uniref:FAR1 domain-containing protein n=1 Tax=Hirsutella rhossiliensis TaxID=111463 RepID=A0A9P8SKS5_9HYPO|nr:uncharacterized protein HRG_01605 [Hirsutella rhossiliensis]KAH0966196.1 hypothetical protein HRG_01605 [Hirsutella rhossiliensis]
MPHTISSRHSRKATSLACRDHTALVASTIPGGNYANNLERQRLRRLSKVEEVDARKEIVARFQSALILAWELAETDSLLARELAKCREDSGLGRAPSERGDDHHGPVLSPTSLASSFSQDGQEYEEWNGFSDGECGDYSDVEPIPNPPIPGTAAPSIEALHAEVNAFAKANGFGVVRRNGTGSQIRKTRYVFECDRYGQPRPSRGSGLRQRRSRKCGCKWKVIAEALEGNNYMWTLRALPDPEHGRHNHERSISLSAHPVHGG